MKGILASRGMGKTTRLLLEAKEAVRNGHKTIFVTYSQYMKSQLQKKYPKIEFITFKDFQGRGLNKENTKIFIDELDLCVAGLLGTHDFTYTLTLGDGR